MPGYGPVVLAQGFTGSIIDVAGGTLTHHMSSRAYFADTCTPGVRTNTQYAAFKLLGKTLRYTTNFAGAGCGCNLALYLVSMRQNTQPSGSNDYYCDANPANSPGGVACPEIDIQEANMYGFHATLHSSHDGNGFTRGIGGGSNVAPMWTGPRDWSFTQYAPGSSCIDSSKPFVVATSFPVNAQGALAGMTVKLSQTEHNCSLSVSLNSYAGMAELSQALAAGMTPAISYWSGANMQWLDGIGGDGRGHCTAGQDAAVQCASTAVFSGFSVSDIAASTLEISSGPDASAAAASAAARAVV